MFRLTLLGTVHRDPRGFVRLVEALDDLKPDIITLEFSTYGLHYRQRHRKFLRQQLIAGLQEILGPEALRGKGWRGLVRTAGIGGIIAFIDLPFEYKGARLHCQRHHLPMFCLDLSSYSHQLLTSVDELLSPANLRGVIAFETSSLQKTVEKEYALAASLLRDGKNSPWQRLITMERQWEKRDAVMAERLRKLTTRHPTCTIVHIGGWQHLTARERTLFTFLEDERPTRVLLSHPSL